MRHASVGLILVLVAAGSMASTREFRRSRLRHAYLERAHRQQEEDSIQREITRRFPSVPQLPHRPPCRVHGEPLDHMPIASGGRQADRMPVVGKDCDDTIPSPPGK
jgi:hypothetical protein